MSCIHQHNKCLLITVEILLVHFLKTSCLRKALRPFFKNETIYSRPSRKENKVPLGKIMVMYISQVSRRQFFVLQDCGYFLEAICTITGPVHTNLKKVERIHTFMMAMWDTPAGIRPVIYQFHEILFFLALLQPITGVSRLDDQIFINRNPGVPSVVKFHPFNTCIAVADKDSIWSENTQTLTDSYVMVLNGNR